LAPIFLGAKGERQSAYNRAWCGSYSIGQPALQEAGAGLGTSNCNDWTSKAVVPGYGAIPDLIAMTDGEPIFGRGALFCVEANPVFCFQE
jgi:hypothetical protein